MTKEGRLQTHLNCLAQGKPSPYADEFADYNETFNETQEIVQEKKRGRPKK